MFAALLLVAAALPPLPHSPDLYVSGFFSSTLQRFAGPRSAAGGPHPAPGESGAIYTRNVARRPWGIAVGPDGNIYVANLFGIGGAIMRVKGPFSDAPGSTELFADGSAEVLAFGPDGNLYAGGLGAIRRYDLVTRALIGEFTHGHDLQEVRGMAFGPDGNLYVANYDSCVSGPTGCTGSKGEIARYDGLAGEFIDLYVPSGRGGMMWPYGIVFGPTGELFVANSTPTENSVLRFWSPLRSPVGLPYPNRGIRSAAFITRPGLYPIALAIGPDYNLYVGSSETPDSGSVLRFDSVTGVFIDAFVPRVEGGPRGIAFAPGAR